MNFFSSIWVDDITFVLLLLVVGCLWCCVVSSCGRGLWIRVCFVAVKPCLYDDDLELLLLMLMLAHL
jgi:hypothetical protein